LGYHLQLVGPAAFGVGESDLLPLGVLWLQSFPDHVRLHEQLAVVITWNVLHSWVEVRALHSKQFQPHLREELSFAERALRAESHEPVCALFPERLRAADPEEGVAVVRENVGAANKDVVWEGLHQTRLVLLDNISDVVESGRHNQKFS